jgi:periplasmic divalent cation tolerance protein
VIELCEVVITAPDPDWLYQFTRELIDRRLCSSVHNFAPVRSIYRWQGEVHERVEGRASLHTRRELVAEIVRYAKDRHPYQLPGISARPIYDGNPAYLSWIADETDSDRPSR